VVFCEAIGVASAGKAYMCCRTLRGPREVMFTHPSAPSNTRAGIASTAGVDCLVADCVAERRGIRGYRGLDLGAGEGYSTAGEIAWFWDHRAGSYRLDKRLRHRRPNAT
jgi:hypothetical protein